MEIVQGQDKFNNHRSRRDYYIEGDEGCCVVVVVVVVLVE